MTDQELKDFVVGLALKSDRRDAQLAASEAARAKSQDRVDAQMAETTRKLEFGLSLSKPGAHKGNPSTSSGRTVHSS